MSGRHLTNLGRKGRTDVKKKEIIENLRESRREMDQLLQGLEEDEMTEPKVMDGWSLKDILAHISRWEAELVTMLFELKRGKEPSRARIEGMDDVDRLNAKWYEEDKDRPLHLVQGDFRGLRKQTIRRLEGFSEEELNDPERYDALRGEPLWRWVAVDTYEHEREHAEFIRSWLEERG